MTPTVDVRATTDATPSTSDASDATDGLLEEVLSADRRDTVDVDGGRRQRRKSVIAVFALLCSFLLVLGVSTGYLDAESVGKCGECIQSLSSSTSTSFLQNDTLTEDALRTVAY
jgi:ABC-type histidine transport system ATPase subunit